MESLEEKTLVEEEEDNECIEYHPIETLEDSGINISDIKKLIEKGFKTLESIAYTPKKNLFSIKGLSENKVDRIIEIANQKLKLGIRPCSVAIKERNKITKITSGPKELDTLLGGGFESIYIIYSHKF